MGHSHGARLTAATLHLLGGGEVEGTRLTYLPPPEQRIRSVLIAGALDHHWLDPGQRFGMALCRTECLLYMRNDHDSVLNLYPLRRVFSRRALGEKGLSRKDHERLGYLNAKVVQLDVTRIIQLGHMWNNYYIHPELAAAIEPYVYFDDGQPSFPAASAAADKPAWIASGPIEETPQPSRFAALRPRFTGTSTSLTERVNGGPACRGPGRGDLQEPAALWTGPRASATMNIVGLPPRHRRPDPAHAVPPSSRPRYLSPCSGRISKPGGNLRHCVPCEKSRPAGRSKGHGIGSECRAAPPAAARSFAGFEMSPIRSIFCFKRT